MDSVPHKMLGRRHLPGFSVFLLAAHLVLTNACDNDPTRSDCSAISVSVQEGSSLDVPLNTSDTILDVCVWNSSTSRWENACHFSGQACKPLLPYFKEHISLAKGSFVLRSARRDSGRIYELLDSSGKCVASINVSVSDPGVTTYPPTSLPPATTKPNPGVTTYLPSSLPPGTKSPSNVIEHNSLSTTILVAVLISFLVLMVISYFIYKSQRQQGRSSEDLELQNTRQNPTGVPSQQGDTGEA